ncbi:hypothetical protein HDV00_002132 [Rhizophlyctis rosea]|nr:hypothetical protein HDV00_002132 [Rhizophlyctis rosea]
MRSLLISSLLGLVAILAPAGGSAPAGYSFDPNTVRKRHDYRLTFKQPYFLYENEHPRVIPNFETHGSTISSRDFIRLTPSIADQQGSVWSKLPNSYKDWQVVFSFKVAGQGHFGGTGFAFWYTQDKAVQGSMLGSRDEWKGFGLIFTAHDQRAERYTPLIYGMMNDHNVAWAHRLDYMGSALGHCYSDFRGTPHPGYARITYKDSTLIVEIDMRQNGKGFIPCFTATNVNLPIGYHFGFSAATGVHASVSDDHDIISFDTYDLNPAPPRPKPLTAEQKQKMKDLENFQFSEEQKQHIEQAESEVHEMWKEAEEGGETGESRQLNQLMENQFHILETLSLIQQKQEQGGGGGSGSSGGAIDHTVHAILNDIKDRLHKIEVSIAELTPQIQSMSHNQNAQMGNVQQKLDAAHDALKASNYHLSSVSAIQHETKEALKNAKGHWGLYSLAFVIGLIVAYVANSVRRKREDSKKFI